MFSSSKYPLHIVASNLTLPSSPLLTPFLVPCSVALALHPSPLHHNETSEFPSLMHDLRPVPTNWMSDNGSDFQDKYLHAIEVNEDDDGG